MIREHIAGRPGAERNNSRARYHTRQRDSLGAAEALIDNHPAEKTSDDLSVGDLYAAWDQGVLVKHRHGISDGTHGSRKLLLSERLYLDSPDIWMD